MTSRSGALEGLVVVDFTSTTTGAHVTQTLADFGAQVLLVEPPDGSPLRATPAWPFWGPGKRSVVLDLKLPNERDQARQLADTADVVVETWRPGVADRLGLGYHHLSAGNPRLVYASITGFGRDNPLAHLKGYEPIVMAKIGMLDAFSALKSRPGPSFVSGAYGAFSASQTGLHGILAALIEREQSGLGQRVETTMVQGIMAHDPWNWLIRLLAHRFHGAFSGAAPTTQTPTGNLVPNSPLFLRLMVGFTKDGNYMQFSQVSERLWQAFLRLTRLPEALGDDWGDGSIPEDPEVRLRWLDTAIAITRTKTYAEWLEAFDAEPDVWAELFRDGTELLDHPQLVADGWVSTIEDPRSGPVREPGPLVAMSGTPAVISPPPELDGNRAQIAAPSERRLPPRRRPARRRIEPPLAGITILELGSYYAGPFGATLLTDLGARVIKIEPLEGEPQRNLMPFPEVAGIKVLQGKQSVGIDIATEDGRGIVLDLVRRSDVVLQTFRAGVAARHGYTAGDLMAVNPDLFYLNAPGYGVGPPYGHRPAYAPTIGAGSGLAYRNVGGRANVPANPALSAEEVRLYTQRMSGASLTVGTADGFAALGVATALLLGLLVKRRLGRGQEMSTSMLSTMAHCLAEGIVDYPGRAPLAGRRAVRPRLPLSPLRDGRGLGLPGRTH
jgi:crotonobetainyl-CoA:carnitine CoA-transferase CaiB-like acyl-CoA transferase